MPKRIRALLIAEAANPEWASVPLIGWSLTTALAQQTDAHIVTQVRNRDAFLRAGLREGIDFTAINSEAVARPMWHLAHFLRGGSSISWTTQTAIASLAYPYFERLVWREFGEQIRNKKFDVVHRITPLTPTAASSLATRCASAGVPFVMGPLNGGVPWPAGFDHTRRQEREWLSYVRSVYKYLPARRRTLRDTKVLLMGSRHTLSEVPEAYRAKCIYLPENAVDPARFNRVAQPGNSAPLRACFVGRMVPYKGPDMFLEAALPLLQSGALSIDFIGDGPLMTALRDQVAASEVGDSVRFHGWVAHTLVQDIMCQNHIMVLPSVREFGGGVVLEAMALGVVPVVVDYAGPGELVDADVGFKIAIGSRASIISSLRDTLQQLASAPGKLQALAAQGRLRALTHYSWQAKAAQVVSAYEWAIGRSTQKPLFQLGKAEI